MQLVIGVSKKLGCLEQQRFLWLSTAQYSRFTERDNNNIFSRLILIDIYNLNFRKFFSWDRNSGITEQPSELDYHPENI